MEHPELNNQYRAAGPDASTRWNCERLERSGLKRPLDRLKAGRAGSVKREEACNVFAAGDSLS